MKSSWGKSTNDDGVVNKIWCVVCKEFGTAWRLTSYESKLELMRGYYDVTPGSGYVNFCRKYNSTSVTFTVLSPKILWLAHLACRSHIYKISSSCDKKKRISNPGHDT